jgi:hypothetical protein
MAGFEPTILIPYQKPAPLRQKPAITIGFTVHRLTPGTNPTIVIYNASDVKICNFVKNLQRHE